MMHRFHKVEEGAVITLCRGVYRQSPLYRRKNAAYAGHAGGFVRLLSGGGTGIPHVSWKEIDAPGYDVVEAVFSVELTASAVAEAAE